MRTVVVLMYTLPKQTVTLHVAVGIAARYSCDTFAAAYNGVTSCVHKNVHKINNV